MSIKHFIYCCLLIRSIGLCQNPKVNNDCWLERHFHYIDNLDNSQLRVTYSIVTGLL